MKKYIGVKEVNACPMSHAHFLEVVGRTGGAIMPHREGYLVEYPGSNPNHPDYNGYISWSPVEEFEKAYICADREYSAQQKTHELAAELKELKEQLDRLSEYKTHVQKMYDHLSMIVLPERMEEEDIVTLQIKGVGRLQASHDIRCNVLAKNRSGLEQWMVDNGHGALVTNTINSSTLKAFVKEAMREGKEYPEHLIKVEPYSKATIVKR